MKKSNFTFFWCCAFLWALAALPLSVNGQQAGALACNDNVQVSLDADCGGITPDMFLEGGVSPLPVDYDLTVSYQDGTGTDGGTADGQNDEFTGINWREFLNWTVKYTLVATYADGSTNSCWGTVTIEDNLPPTLDPDSDFVCEDIVDGTCADLYNTRALNCLFGNVTSADILSCDRDFELFFNYDYDESVITDCDPNSVTRTVTVRYKSHGEFVDVIVCQQTATIAPLTVGDVVCPTELILLPCGSATSSIVNGTMVAVC